MTRNDRTNRKRARVGLVVALLGTLLLGAPPAIAGIGGSDTPTWPPTATVGDLIGTSVLITNGSTFPNNTESVNLTTLFVTPACADGVSSVCLAGNEDPGIFKIVTAVGDASTGPCAGITFTIGAPNLVTGEVALTPSSTVTLGPVSGGVNLSCQVNLQLRVFAVPANPAPGPDFTTDPLTRAALVGVTSGLGGTASGSAQIRISPGTVTIATLSNPNGTVAPGASVTDTVKVTKAPGAAPPTGSVRFILCQPNEVGANGCVGGTGTTIPPDKVLDANGEATSDPVSGATTLTLGTYCWRVRYLGDDNYEAQNHFNNTTECFTVAQQPSTTTTQASTNATNVLPGSSVTDTATVTGGVGQPTPTGTVTFFLCQPNEVTAGGCVSPAGAQVGNAKTLSNGQVTSDASTNTSTIGTYCWRAVYAGDAFYLGSSHTNATTECFTTAVVCDITIDKTCTVESAFTCTKPITALTMQLDPTSTLSPSTNNCVRIAGTAGANPATPFDIDNICPGDVVTVGGYNGNQGNDVLWNVCAAGSGGACNSSNAAFIGQSSFHLSCSDSDMNSADDCGKAEGNNKGSTSCLPGNNNASCIDKWLLAGITGPVGSPPSASLVCPGFATGQTTCEITPEPFTCTKPITALTMQWTGAVAVRIAGTAGSSPATPFDIDDIDPGDTITVSGYNGNQGNDVLWNICAAGSVGTCDSGNAAFIGQSSFHLSCSDADMNSADDCGKLEGNNKGNVNCLPGNTNASCVNLWALKGITGPAGSPSSATLDCANPNGSVPVTYTYVVTNNTATPVTGISVTDAITDSGGTTVVPICGPFDLAGNGTHTCQAVDQVGEDTTNIATASNGTCSDESNQVTVTVVKPCATGAPALAFKDKTVTWNLTGPASHDVEISKIEITFPSGTNGPLKQVNLDPKQIFSGSLASPATITTFSGTPGDRTVKKGKTEPLKFTFQNQPVGTTGYDITVTFVNGCSVHITQ